MKRFLPALAAVFLAAGVARAADDSLFPFVLPWDDATSGITNVSGLLDKPAGGRGFVVARNGHLFEGDKRFRIFGVNTVFGANFPTHEDAEKVAARMAKFGLNCVRFHHMDWRTAPDGIWNADMKTLDPAQLDKLDYFIAQLKKNGIYADLNLHVSLTYPGMPKWEKMPGFFKGVDNFYPPMIAEQHDYARQLLTHLNPYTKNAYIDEPAVAIIEINNENGLISEWWGGSFDGMPDVYRDELQSQWNRWLKAKYPAPAALETAWKADEEPLGAEMLKENNFENGAGKTWYLEQHGDGKAAALPDAGGIRVNVSQTDPEGWHVQLAQSGLSLAKEKRYTISFRAKADSPRKIAIVASQSRSPWSQIWSGNVELTGDWKDYHFTFQASADEPDARIVFSNLASTKGSLWLADASLRPGGIFGLKKEEQAGAVPVFKKSEFAARTEVAQRDWMTFLYETESNFWTGMKSFIQKDLGAHSLVVGTATGYSPPSIQANMDVVDCHAYWQHPRFPHKQWDMSDWTVDNVSMAGAANGGTLPGLFGNRVAGKPYICTEYNAAAPNTHASEAFLLLNAYAAFQDWDGIFVFAYSHRHDDWDSQRICGFFDLDQHPTKLATLPAAVSMFLRGDVSPAKQTVTAWVYPEMAIETSLHWGSWWGARAFGIDRSVSFQSGLQLDVNPAKSAPIRLAPDKDKEKEMEGVQTSDTGELAWDVPGACVTVNTPRNKAFIGKITGEPIKLGGITIEPQKNLQDWAAITITQATGPDGAPVPGDYLITATGYAENTGMVWTDSKKDSVGTNWGQAPSRVEGIRARITLPLESPAVGTASEAWALDGRGQRAAPVKATRTGAGVVLDIGPQYKTLWYEVKTR